ncbi:hypothetical protein [Legionella oakridgensis]|uniref:Uncharacterized protein n=2 Tax=Legionella oakridgensis TaxID=29423 RepID=W0B7V7_9GAMM|nr:hypothetical protein [Legionella oakridgensis]AHE66623.1 hypothetical protein Loa_01067 [Legionella oakridgensis ATCC 33761 = DSM 21215]KTD37782.1 hypothetical protein Loak_1458 [Legionella oakridgensis]STY19766.1 Uncharacterised protein [Legionella longbeachae]
MPTPAEIYWPTITFLLVRALKQPYAKNTDLSWPVKSSYFELAKAAVTINAEEGSVFAIAFHSFLTELEKQKLSRSQLDAAVRRFNEIPDIQNILDQLSERLKVLGPSPESNQMLLRLSPRTSEEIIAMQENISNWVAHEYSPVDERVAACDARRIRRMDSLARLFALNSSLSACTAVTLDTSEVPRLVIGANVGKQGDQEIIMAVIAKKLRIIQRFMQKNAEKLTLSCPLSELEVHAKTLIKALFPERTIGDDPDTQTQVLLQAAMKIIHAVCIDDTTFTAEEKQAFGVDAPAVILLPTMQGALLKMQGRHITAKGWLDSEFDLPPVPVTTSVKDIHAEQLIARYLFVECEHPHDESFIFGISKLCCRTCFDHLITYPGVLVRGHHGQSYQGVINLRNGEIPTESSARRATTHAWPSPKDTPAREQREETSDHLFSMLAARNSLFPSPKHLSPPSERRVARTLFKTPPRPPALMVNRPIPGLFPHVNTDGCQTIEEETRDKESAPSSAPVM